MTLPFDHSRCPDTIDCPLANRCLRHQDPGHPTNQAHTLFPGGMDCYAFIPPTGYEEARK